MDKDISGRGSCTEKRVLIIVPAGLATILVIGLSFAQVATACYDRIDAGPAWMKGYHDAQS